MSQLPLAPPPQTGQPIDGWMYLLWKFIKQILPSQTGNSGKYLKTDGTDASWETVASSGGGAVPNVISAPTTIADETSYLVIDHISVEDDLTIEGYLGVTDLSTGETGTVTSVSVVSANGFAGTVATATTTPAITLSTSITGVFKGNGTAISAATSGTDYSAGTSALSTGIVKSTTTTGALSIAVSGTDYSAGTSALSTGIVKSTTTTGALSIAVSGTDYQPPLPSGVMFPYGGSSAPSGWLLCDGSAVSRTTYAALFTAISTSFGVGDGSTTFNLPNTARRTIVGAGGTGTATLANTVGSTGGSETHTLSTAELAVHSHGVTDPTHSHNYYLPNSDTAGAGVAVGVSSDGSASTATTSSSTGVSINNAGSGSAHNNMQPSLVTNFIIKT